MSERRGMVSSGRADGTGAATIGWYNSPSVTTAAPLSASLVLASRFENIEVAEHVLRDLCAKVDCGEEDLRGLLSALWEGLANAIRHGNQQKPQRRVEVEYSVGRTRVVITIRDQGEGFEVEDVPDPTEPENLLRPNGRGIFFMKQLMDRVEFERSPEGGTVVVMERCLNRDVGSSHNEE